MTIPVQFNSRSFKPTKIIFYATTRSNPDTIPGFTTAHLHAIKRLCRKSAFRSIACGNPTSFRAALCQPAVNHA